jgi:pyrroloquinoline quinone (PQQ) biosynthesis protein C
MGTFHIFHQKLKDPLQKHTIEQYDIGAVPYIANFLKHNNVALCHTAGIILSAKKKRPCTRLHGGD